MNVHYYALRMSHFAKHLAELVLVIRAELGAVPFLRSGDLCGGTTSGRSHDHNCANVFGFGHISLLSVANRQTTHLHMQMQLRTRSAVVRYQQ